MKSFLLVGLIDPQQRWTALAYGIWLLGVSLLATGLAGLAYVRFWIHLSAPGQLVRSAPDLRFTTLAAEKFARIALQAWPVAVLGLFGRLFTSAAPLRPLGYDPTILDSLGRASTGRVLALLALLCVVAALIRTELDPKRRAEHSIRSMLAGLIMVVLLLVDIGTSTAPFRVTLGVMIVCALALMPVRRVLQDAPAFFEMEASETPQSATSSFQGLSLQPIGRREYQIMGFIVMFSLTAAFGLSADPSSSDPASGRALAVGSTLDSVNGTAKGTANPAQSELALTAPAESTAPNESESEVVAVPQEANGTSGQGVASEPATTPEGEDLLVESAPPVQDSEASGARATDTQDETVAANRASAQETPTTPSNTRVADEPATAPVAATPVAGQAQASSELPDPEGPALSNDVITAKCQNNVAVQACYQRATLALLRANGISKMLAQTAELIDKDPEASRHCHDTLHKVGREALKLKNGDLAKVTAEGNFICSTGFFHGAIEERLALFSMDQLPKELPKVCVVDEKDPASYPTNSCIHGLGHGLLIKTNDLFKALKLCDTLEPLNAEGRPDYRDWCAQGAFMQNSINLNEPAAKAEFDLNDPLYPCTKTPVHQVSGCYRQQASHYMASFRINDFEQVAKTVCEKAPSRYARDCYAGLGSSMGPNRPADVIIKTCTEIPASPEGREYCISSAASQLILFTGKRERSDELCAAAKEPYAAMCTRATNDNWKRVSSASTYAVAKKTGEV